MHSAEDASSKNSQGFGSPYLISQVYTAGTGRLCTILVIRFLSVLSLPSTQSTQPSSWPCCWPFPVPSTLHYSLCSLWMVPHPQLHRLILILAPSSSVFWPSRSGFHISVSRPLQPSKAKTCLPSILWAHRGLPWQREFCF